MKGIKVEWCENWIKARFARLPVKNGGIEAGYFWKLAEESGLRLRKPYPHLKC